MLTTDFSGAYDYEQEEALHAANYILESLHDGEISPGTLPAAILKELQHWKKFSPKFNDGLPIYFIFGDFEEHFNAQINAGLPAALAGYKLTTGE